MSPEHSIAVERSLNSNLQYERHELYKQADQLVERVSKPLLWRLTLNAGDFLMGVESKQRKFDAALRIFEKATTYEREKLSNSKMFEVPEAYHEFINKLDLDML